MKLKHRILRKKDHKLKAHGTDFESIVSEATQAMPAYRQRFSAFIHIKAVSDVSDLIGRTIARPNPILFGAATSFFVTITLYLLAKNLGYSLSGFEGIGAFAAGWTAGMLFDLARYVIKRD